MEILKNIKNKPLKILLISAASITILITLFFITLFIIFYTYKQDISKNLLLTINQKIQGQISFSDLSINLLRNFPGASLIVYDFRLEESKDTGLNQGRLPVFDLKEAYISVNAVDLFSKKINASAISFEDGIINIVVYPDSSTNLEKAIQVPVQRTDTSSSGSIVTDSTDDITKKTEETSFLSIKIDKLEMTNIEASIENQITKNKLYLNLNELESKLSFSENLLTASINLDTNIDSLILNDKLILSNRRIDFESDFKVNTDSIFVEIINGRFSIDEAKLFLSGIFNVKNQGYIDLSFSVSDDDFSLFSLIFSDEGKNNLKSGKVFFEGSIKGNTLIEFPTTEISFGLKNVVLLNPVSKREIKNFNLNGKFFSGNKSDLSDAKLIINKMHADFPDGVFRLTASAHNLILPDIEANIYVSADVTGLEKVFNLGSITDLKGKIEIADNVKGRFYFEEKKFVTDFNEGKISFENFGFKVPGTILFDNINGTVKRINDDIRLYDLKIISGDTDLLINGEIQNAMALLFNREEEITGNLQIQSGVFDLPNFLFFDPSIKRDFNHRILDVDVDVVAKTTTTKATKFKSFPEMDFDIKKIHATAEGFLPHLKINSGIFKISESILGFNLKFKNFKTDFLKGKFYFTGEYNTSAYQPFYIKANANFKEIYPEELLYSEADTVPEFLQGKLTGSFFTEFQFPTDSTILKYIKLKNANLIYEYPTDTITTKNLMMDFARIYFNNDTNIFATLSTTGILTADNIKSSSVNFSDLEFNVRVTNGSYEIRSDVVRLFGENAKGKALLVANPFDEKPSYRISYSDVNFRAEKMLSTFNEDPIISGPIFLAFDVAAQGFDPDEIVKSLDGHITLTADHLILKGFDADELINDFKRSQNFNLVDLGAVLLAGPVGLAVTKGSDFARILVLNTGKTTNINKMVSNWTIKDGVFIIQDAAFSTPKNRIALVGSIGFAEKNLALTIALLDKKGCSIFSQEVYGDLDAPQLGKVKVVGTVLAPVTNLVDNVTGKDCVVFYQGAVEQPK